MKKGFILLLCAIICHTLHAQEQDEDIRDYFMPEAQKINIYLDFKDFFSNSISQTQELWEQNGKQLYEVINYTSNNTPLLQTTMQLKITKNSIEVSSSQSKGFINPDSYYTKGSTLLKLPTQGDKNQWEWRGHIYSVSFEEDNEEKLLILKDVFKATGALLHIHIYAKGRGYLYTLSNGKVTYRRYPIPALSSKEEMRREEKRKKIEEQKRQE